MHVKAQPALHSALASAGRSWYKTTSESRCHQPTKRRHLAVHGELASLVIRFPHFGVYYLVEGYESALFAAYTTIALHYHRRDIEMVIPPRSVSLVLPESCPEVYGWGTISIGMPGTITERAHESLAFPLRGLLGWNHNSTMRILQYYVILTCGRHNLCGV